MKAIVRFHQEEPLRRALNGKERVMRTITASLLALGFVGAMALGAASPTKAQGVYFSGPGVEVQVGNPYWYRRHHRRHHYRHYRYYGGGPYAYAPRYRTWNGCPYGYTIQDGVCKPYRGY
jgi:hypothetical protein